MKSVFFSKPGESGLTETAAAKLAAIASNKKTESETLLANLSFTDVEMELLAVGKKTRTYIGNTDLSSINKAVEQCAELNSLIAYLAEARKALEAYRKEVSKYGLEEYLKFTGQKLPEAPMHPDPVSVLSFEDGVNLLSIKERTEYLALEARAATLGKIVHPKGSLALARIDLHNKLHTPVTITGEGDQTRISYWTPSIPVEKIDALFEFLQKEQQEAESYLNHMKTNIRNNIEEINAERLGQFQVEMAKYDAENQTYHNWIVTATAQETAWRQKLLQEAAHIKIAIPKKYENLVKELQESR